MSNSSLVSVVKYSPNHSGERTEPISRITPHCVVGQLSADRLGDVFLPESRKASSNYGIGKDGEIGLYVDECNRSWCSSSSDNDNKAVTIECASDLKEPYAMNSKVYTSLIALCVDICKRNGKTKLLWIDDKEKALSYKCKDNEMIITLHRWLANKSCPGNWLVSRLPNLAAEVTRQLNAKEEPAKPTTLYKVQVGAYSIYGNAANMLKKIQNDGYTDAFITKVGNLHKVQVGAYSVKKNADAMLKKVQKSGYKDAFIVEVSTASTTVAKKKSNMEIAKEVIAGKWGVGDDRKKRLIAAGYDYATIQNMVNILCK